MRSPSGGCSPTPTRRTASPLSPRPLWWVVRGGGGGHDERGQEGEGGGFGVVARPAGAYIVKDGTVRWRPAVDVNRLVAAIGAVAIAYLFTRARIEKARATAASNPPDRL